MFSSISQFLLISCLSSANIKMNNWTYSNLLDVVSDEVCPELRKTIMERWNHEQCEDWQDKYRMNKLLKKRQFFYRIGCFIEIWILAFISRIPQPFGTHGWIYVNHAVFPFFPYKAFLTTLNLEPQELSGIITQPLG